MIDTCKQKNYPAPNWQLESNGLWVIFEFPQAHFCQRPDETGQAEAWGLKVLQACSRSEPIHSHILSDQKLGISKKARLGHCLGTEGFWQSFQRRITDIKKALTL